MRRPRRDAFTLVEVLMVAAIIAVVAAITVPMFVRSIHGNRLRAASRTVVMAGRYARNMAILSQREMALVFDLDGAVVAVHPVPTSFVDAGGAGEVDAAAPAPGGRAAPVIGDATAAAPADDGPTLPAGLGAAEITRPLDRVAIDYVEKPETEERIGEGRCTVVYRSNGTCMPYTIRLADERGEAVTVTVDMLAGAETERS